MQPTGRAFYLREHLRNLDLNYKGTVHFTSSDPEATLPADAPVTQQDAGFVIWPRSMVLRRAGTTLVTVTDVATGTVLSRQTYQVVAAGLNSINVVIDPNTAVAGQSLSVSLTPVDPSGNVNKAFRGQVACTSQDAQATLPPAVAFTAASAGHLNLPSALVFRTAGAQQLSCVGAGNAAGVTTVQVQPGPAVQLVAKLADTVTAGASNTITLTATDSFNKGRCRRHPFHRVPRVVSHDSPMHIALSASLVPSYPATLLFGGLGCTRRVRPPFEDTEEVAG